MVLLVQILSPEGTELYSYKTKEADYIPIDNGILLDFFHALQNIITKDEKKIHSINLSNMMVYSYKMKEESCFMLFNEFVEENKLKEYFNRIESIISSVKESTDSDTLIKELNAVIGPMLDPYKEEEATYDLFAESMKEQRAIKIAFAGLGNAGKTSLKRMFFEKWTKEMVEKIQPTVGIEIMSKFLEYLQDNITIYDFGGQLFYRKEYAKDLNKWSNITVLIYVVDIQDRNSFKTSMRYLKDICETIDSLHEKPPKMAIFFHKCDPEIQPTLKDNIIEVLELFDEFSDKASFHFTSIEDNRGNMALIKTLYYSLPQLLIKRILLDKFTPYFEYQVLPQYRSEKDTVDWEKKKTEIFERSVNHGMRCAFMVQRDWLETLISIWRPATIVRGSTNVTVGEEKDFMIVTMPNYHDLALPGELLTLLLHGIISGIVKTFYLKEPTILRKDLKTITFKISLDEG
ncbi:MAG: Rab family GTPase [Candidatus Hodarchaeales archaeon]